MFIPYHTLSRNLIENLAKDLLEIEKGDLEKIVAEKFFTYFREIISPYPPSYSMEIISLLDVPGAMVLIFFDKHPFRPQDRAISGFSRLVRQRDSGQIIPCIYLMPNHADDTIEHERIHICQYLLDSAYPMTSEQREFYLFFPESMIDCFLYLRENFGNSIASDFIINAACYVLWIEMEANYATIKPDKPWPWMEKVYKSASPLMKFQFLYENYGWDADEIPKFKEFCDILENEVDWVKEIVTRISSNSLYDAIWELHDEFETELMFGPIEE